MVIARPIETVLPPGVLDEPDPDVTLGEFFDPAFMDEHTRFSTFAAFCGASPWQIEDREDIGRIPTARLDRFVRRTTRFEHWRDMRNRAAEREVRERLLV